MGPPGQPWARWSGFWGFPLFLALVQAVAVTVHLQDMNVVGETVTRILCDTPLTDQIEALMRSLE